MTTTLAPSPTRIDPPTASRRFGYVVAALVNGVVLWVVHHLLAWGWPDFLTSAFERVLPLVTASLVVGIALNLSFLVRDRGRYRAAGDLVNAAFGLAVSVRTWDVFPFDFGGYAVDWTWLVRTALVLAIVGTAIGGVVAMVRLVRGPGGVGR